MSQARAKFASFVVIVGSVLALSGCLSGVDIASPADQDRLEGVASSSASRSALLGGRHLGEVASGESIGALEIGIPIFWDGEFVEDSVITDPALNCQEPTARCFSYSFDVPAGGWRLRVAFDDPGISELFTINLQSPNGTMLGPNGPVMSKEYFASEPPAGRWTLYVNGTRVEDATFRMRALLEDAPRAPRHDRGPRDLLPNLRFLPPFELTFTAPIVSVVMPHGPGSNVSSEQPASCTAAETANNTNLRRCLRFSYGPQNSGDGPLEVRYHSPGSLLDPADAVQIVHRDDGSTYTRPAGTARYHTTHAHFHHMGFGGVELLRVDDLEKGDATLVGLGPKHGVCLGSYLIIDWQSFAQDQRKFASTCDDQVDDAVPFEGAVFWLTRGYSDVYGWSFEDNYVDFGSNPDGLYVLRAVTDPDDIVLETDETDNTGYTLIRVKGNDIEVLERGYGDGPWDNKRTLDSDHLIYDLADVNWLPFTDAK